LAHKLNYLLSGGVAASGEGKMIEMMKLAFGD